jgi:hypothetical protein
MESKNARPKSPGLKWRARQIGPPIPYWFADKKAIDAGYPVKSANLSTFADNPAKLIERAQRLQSEMLLWLSGQVKPQTQFDGTFKSLLDSYERDPESSYQGRKPGVKETYGVYIRRLTGHIGGLRIDHVDGRDVKRWFAMWRTDPNGRDRLPRARMVIAVLNAAVSFGVVCREPGCKAFQDVLSELTFETVPSRTFAPTADQIDAARKAAHAAGAPLRALLYALIYDTTGREFDFLGEWLPLNYKKPSAIISYGKKWIGPMWSAIDEDLILTIKPTKTEDTTGVEVTFDLSVCPMVMEELALIEPAKRHGPLIINQNTGLPYIYETFRLAWNADFEAAGMPAGMWCRDMRAGGVTEGGKSGASKDDRRKVAGHAKERQTEKYDRDQLEAFRRTMKSRTGYRAKNGS